MCKGEKKKRKMHIIRTRHGVPGSSEACLCGRTGACGLGSEASALDGPSWASWLVKQLVTQGTRRPGSDHRAVWTEPDPERWNPALLPGFFLLQNILGPTWPSL